MPLHTAPSIRYSRFVPGLRSAVAEPDGARSGGIAHSCGAAGAVLLRSRARGSLPRGRVRSAVRRANPAAHADSKKSGCRKEPAWPRPSRGRVQGIARRLDRAPSSDKRSKTARKAVPQVGSTRRRGKCWCPVRSRRSRPTCGSMGFTKPVILRAASAATAPCRHASGRGAGVFRAARAGPGAWDFPYPARALDRCQRRPGGGPYGERERHGRYGAHGTAGCGPA